MAGERHSPSIPRYMTGPSHGDEGPPLHRFPIFAPYTLVEHAVFTRHGGVSAAPHATLNVSYSVGDALEKVAENRGRCAAALGLPVRSIITAGLVHGATVAVAEAADTDPLPDGSRVVRDVDA